jgi:hypothetical protein
MTDQPNAGERQRDEVYQAFPERPITDPNLLSGRAVTMRSCREIIERKGSTLLLYGDHGVGKTSVWRVLLQGRRYAEALAVDGLSLPQLFLQILSKYGLDLIESNLTFEDSSELASEIGASAPSVSAKIKSKITSKTGGQTQPVELRRLNVPFLVDKFEDIQKSVDFLVLEEIHRIGQVSAREDLVRLIKALSDRTSISLRLVIVGSARRESDLLSGVEYARYQNRQIWKSVPVLPLTHTELIDLLKSREQSLGMKFEGKTGDDLAWISAGYPYVASTLARRACLLWLTKNFRVAFRSEKGGFFGWLLRAFGREKSSEGEGIFSSLGVKIGDAELRETVAAFSQAADAESIQWYRDLVLKDDLDTVDVLRIIQSLAAAEEPVELAKIAEQLGLSDQRVMRLMQRYCGDMIEVDDQQRLDITHQELRWFCRSVAYLTPSVAYP